MAVDVNKENQANKSLVIVSSGSEKERKQDELTPAQAHQKNVISESTPKQSEPLDSQVRSKRKEKIEHFQCKSSEIMAQLPIEEAAWFAELFRWLTDDNRALEEEDRVMKRMTARPLN